MAETTKGRRSSSLVVVGVALCLGAVLAVFWPTTISMVEIWRRSETFQHCFIVLPISIWLVWRERARFASVPVVPFWPGALLVSAFGAVWLLGELGAAQVVSQSALIGMAVAMVLSIFGKSLFQVIWFPMLFLFFAVPFGEFLVPKLIELTADFTVAALRLSRVPVYREATNFVIPTGSWSVVEACSGIRYLIASLMSGSLFAWLMYRSPVKRALFVAAAVGVPIVANWVRAYGIVMLGHLSGNRIATGVDHLVYGWLFFGVVILAMFWVGSYWRDDVDSTTESNRSAPIAPLAVSRRTAFVTSVAVVTCLLVWPVLAVVLGRSGDTRPLGSVSISATNGWALIDEPVSTWRPTLMEPPSEQFKSFSKAGRKVTVNLGLYRNQHQGSELVNSQNVIVADDDVRWKLVESGSISLGHTGSPFEGRAVVIRGREGSVAVAHWYWLGSTQTTSDAVAKLDLAVDRLSKRGDTAAWVAIQTPATDGLAGATRVLQEFVLEMGASIDLALSNVARQ